MTDLNAGLTERPWMGHDRQETKTQAPTASVLAS
jgi:hypothetical protein